MKKFIASDASGDGHFGSSVAISGDTAVVGARRADGAGPTNSGSAYVFSRNQGGADNWGEVRRLTASDAAADDRFGSSVSISGDTVVVGPPSDDHAGPFSGSVYVFGRNQGGADNWGEVEKLTASDAEPEANFGRSLAISADTVVIGARRWAGTTSDSAYVFERNKGGPDNWGEVKKLTATVDGTGFGISLSISTDTILVGAHGSASVFSRNQGGADNWGEVNTLTASDGAAGDDFGAAVGINADTALVGAPQDDVNKGAAYVIVPGDRPPSELTIIQPPDGAVFNSGTNIVFQSTATDPEDGDIRA